jgi:hypothetical protein
MMVQFNKKSPVVRDLPCEKLVLDPVLTFWIFNIKIGEKRTMSQIGSDFWSHTALKWPACSLATNWCYCFTLFIMFWYLIISGKMILSKKCLSLQSGEHPSEMDLPEEAHVSVIAVVILNHVHML